MKRTAAVEAEINKKYADDKKMSRKEKEASEFIICLLALLIVSVTLALTDRSYLSFVSSHISAYLIM